MCVPDQSDECEDTTEDGSESDLPLRPIILPQQELDELERRHQKLDLPATHRLPIACGVFRNLQLVGIFPTSRWLKDPTIHPDVKEQFGGSPFFALGEYRVAHLDILDGSGKLHPLMFVLNTGVEGLMTGYWGGVFHRNPSHECWVRFQTTDEHQTTVTTEPVTDSSKSSSSSLGRLAFQDFDGLEVCDESFLPGKAPGVCTTQLECLLGIAAVFLLSLEWALWLPEQLLEVRDTTSRLDRKRRAQERMEVGRCEACISQLSFE